MLSLHHISPTSTLGKENRYIRTVYCEGGGEKERRGNQLVGSILDWVKKLAIVGSPIPSTWGICLSRKWGGMSLGIGCPSSNSIESFIKSRRKSRIVAIKLLLWIKRKMRALIEKEGEGRKGDLPWFCSIPPTWNGYQGNSFLLRQFLLHFICCADLLGRSAVGIHINKVRFILCAIRCYDKKKRRGVGERVWWYLIFKGKMKGGKKDIQFQILKGFRIDQISFLPCIYHHLLSLCVNSTMSTKWSVKEVIKSLTGNNSATIRSNLICSAYRPLRRSFFSHLKSGYFSCSAFSRSALRSVDDAPMFFRSASVIEYQSEGFDVKRGVEGGGVWG